MPGPPMSQQPVRNQEEDFDYGRPAWERGMRTGQSQDIRPHPSKHRGQGRAFLACSQTKQEDAEDMRINEIQNLCSLKIGIFGWSYFWHLTMSSRWSSGTWIPRWEATRYPGAWLG